MAHRWQVSETDQTHVVGTSTNLGGTVDLNITNVINGVNTQTLIFAKSDCFIIREPYSKKVDKNTPVPVLLLPELI